MCVVVVVAGAVTFIAVRDSPTSSALTHPHTSTSTTVPVVKPILPVDLKPLFHTPLTNEGRWVARDRWHAGWPYVMTTFLRVDPRNASTIAYAAWMRSSAVRVGLYLGYKGPGASSLPRGPEQIPIAGRWNLLAAFNSGFYEFDSAEGFYTHNRLYFPMRNGHATLVEYTNGTYDIVNWHNGPKVPANVLMARQNLHLLVANSKPTPLTAQSAAWGVTLHGAPEVWRTALGIDVHGNLIYVAASNQTGASLARVLVRFGAIRAMQLDINPAWPIYVTYGGPSGRRPHLDVPNSQQIPGRFLYTSTKDFFAVYAKTPHNLQTPW